MNGVVGRIDTGKADGLRGAPRPIVVGAVIAWLVTLAMGLATLWTGFATDAIEAIGAANSGVAPPMTPDQVLVVRLVLVAFVAITIGYATVGALLVGRHGAERIGGLLLVAGGLFAVVFFGYIVGGKLIIDEPQSALFSVVLLLGPVAVGPGYSMVLPALAIAFPDGHLPSPRWRGPVGLVAAVIGLGTLVQLVRPGPIVGGPGLGTRNPFGIELLPAGIASLGDVAVNVGIVGATCLGIAAVVARYRRGDSLERQQQRWFLAAVALSALPLALSGLPVIGGPSMALLAAAGLLLVPIAVGIAVTRYRLYEIDHLINRTLVYVPLTALLAGLYAATVALLQRVFQSVTGDRSDAAIIISTLILASVFTPVRKWLESIVERRYKPATSAIATAPGLSEVAGEPEWDARMAAIALRVVRTELEARAVREPQRGRHRAAGPGAAIRDPCRGGVAAHARDVRSVRLGRPLHGLPGACQWHQRLRPDLRRPPHLSRPGRRPGFRGRRLCQRRSPAGRSRRSRADLDAAASWRRLVRGPPIRL